MIRNWINNLVNWSGKSKLNTILANIILVIVGAIGLSILAGFGWLAMQTPYVLYILGAAVLVIFCWIVGLFIVAMFR